MTKDSGCQTNSIVQVVADSNKLEVLKSNVPSTLCGFNYSEDYVTLIVSAPVKLDDQDFVIPAVCVPNININFK